MKKIILVMLMALIGINLLSGCSVIMTKETGTKTPAQVSQPEVDEQPRDQAASGTFQGRIDSSSVEIVIDGLPKAFISTAVERDIGFLKKGEPVEIVYYENENKQLVLKHIYIMD